MYLVCPLSPSSRKTLSSLRAPASRVSLAMVMEQWARNEQPVPEPRPLTDDEEALAPLTLIDKGKGKAKATSPSVKVKYEPLTTYKGKGKAKEVVASEPKEESDGMAEDEDEEEEDPELGPSGDEYPGMEEAISESLSMTTRCESDTLLYILCFCANRLLYSKISVTLCSSSSRFCVLRKQHPDRDQR